ncbi:hypothetical protein FALBO_11886 [Fusarium albosuccineum]|uniref:Uncharacterized protein n=1 Tax=Fusarium albosuccineum TaxID=1237068 RepID=A0A8H4PHK5_9HYPO|nr:hypothetical protein FALBO_11886 [Fusarium albosuccineum]
MSPTASPQLEAELPSTENRKHISQEPSSRSARSSFSKPHASLRRKTVGLGYHGNPVAVLDMKSDEVRPLNLADIEGKGYPSVKIPRWRNNVRIYLPRPGGEEKELIAKVNFRSMGVRGDRFYEIAFIGRSGQRLESPQVVWRDARTNACLLA